MECACSASGAAAPGVRCPRSSSWKTGIKLSPGSPEGINSGSVLPVALTFSPSVIFTVWRLSHVHLLEKQESFDFYLVLPAKLKIPLQPHPQEYLQKLQAFTETT